MRTLERRLAMRDREVEHTPTDSCVDSLQVSTALELLRPPDYETQRSRVVKEDTEWHD